MSHVLYLRPDSEAAPFGGWSQVGGSTGWGDLADGSIGSPNDSTYITNTSDHAPYTIGLSNPVDATYLAAYDVHVLSVQPFYRARNLFTGALVGRMALFGLADGDHFEAGFDVFQFAASFGNAYGSARSSVFNGRWSRDLVTHLGWQLANYSITDSEVSTFVVGITYVLAPTVTVTAPSGAISTATPTVAWTHTHDEGLPQASFRVRVFDAATVARGDFDPATSTPFVDSTEQVSTLGEWLLDQPLVSGTTYQVWVQTAVQTPLGRLYSAWSSNLVLSGVTFQAPAVPDLAVEPQVDAGRVKIVAKATDNLLSTQDSRFERTGVPTTWVKGITNMTAGIGSAVSAPEGAHSLELAKTTSTADMSATTAYAYYVNGSADALTFSCRMRAKAGTTTRSCHATIVAWGVSGIIAAQDGATVSVSSAADVTVSVVAYTPPAATVYVTVFVTVAGAASGDTFGVDVACLRRSTTLPADVTDPPRGGLWTRNLLTLNDSDTDPALGSWVAFNTNTTVARSTTQARTSAASLRLTAGTANSGVAAKGEQVPVIGGEQYVLLASFRAGAGSASGTVGVQWYDGSGNLIGTDSSTGVTVTTAWVDGSVGVTAPVGAAFASLLVSLSGSLANGTLWYVDDVSLARWGDGPMPTSWSPGNDSRTSTWLVIEYTDDGGLTWLPVRGGAHVAPDVFQRVALYDVEVPPNVVRHYRARTAATDDFTGVGAIASENSDERMATVPSGRWWLRSLEHPEHSLGFSRDLCMSSITRKQDERAGRFDGNGAQFPVFISNAVGGQDGSLSVIVYANAWPTFEALIADTTPLVLIDPIDNDLHYVKLTGRSWDERRVGEGAKYAAKLDFVEVARP